MPEPPSGPSAATKRRIGGVQARAGKASKAHGALPDGKSQVSDAERAVSEPEAEANAKAQQALIAQVQAAPSPEIEKLCERIREVIANKRPPDEDALAAAEPDQEAAEAGSQLNATVEGETKKVQGSYAPIEGTPTPGAAKQGQEAPPQPGVGETAPVGAQAAVPDAVPPENVSLDKDAEESRKKAQDAGMNTAPAQLVQSGPVAEARSAQGELDQVAKEDPAKVMAGQQEALTKAEGDMAALQARTLAALEASRTATTKGNVARQGAMVGSEESMRAAAAAEAQKIFSDAKTLVTAQLKDLPATAMAEWDAAKVVLAAKFKADLKPVQDRVAERHSGAGGFVVGLWDAVTGLPDWAEEGYTKAETAFGDGVIAKLREISTKVNAVIIACDLIITDARTRIAKVFADLPGSLGDFAEQERAKFDGQLDRLHDDVTATRDNFNKELIASSSAAVDEVRAEIAELRKKAGGLIGRIVNAINRFIDDPVKFIIEGLLELLGIPPAAFWAVVAKIKKVVGQIADDPLGFANNLLQGLADGFGLFFSNFGTHLLKGFLEWLLGGVKDVQVPKDVSLKSIVTFFLQLMGITWPNIRKILVKLVGAKNVALVEKVYSMVSLLIEKGPEGIYEMIKEKLDPAAIVDQVVQMAVDFMVSAIIKQVSARIIMLFNPAGAILQALEAIYRVLKWVFQNAAKIFTLVETVVNGIADILAGNTAAFAAAVEKGLAMLIAPVISFIADYLSLGDLPSIVADKVKSMREWILGLIESALTWLVEKGKALLAAMGIGKKDDKKEKGKFDGTIGDKVRWTAEEETHELWISDAAGEPEPMMASAKPATVKSKLEEYRSAAAKLKTTKAEGERRGRAEAAISEAFSILATLVLAASATKAAQVKGEEGKSELEAKDDETESLEEQLWPQLQTIQIALRLLKLPKTMVSGGGSKASTVTASPLSKEGDTGSRPSGRMRGWDHVLSIDRMPLNVKKGQSGPGYWVAAHLVSEELHGPGRPWNTVPMRKRDNKAMEIGIESNTKDRIAADEVLSYTATVDYHAGPVLEDFPSHISIQRSTMRFQNGAWVSGEGLSGYESDIDPPPLVATQCPDINELGRDGLLDRGLPQRFAMAVDDERYDGGRFVDLMDFVTRMNAVYARRKGGSDKVTEGLAVVGRLITAGKIRIGG